MIRTKRFQIDEVLSVSTERLVAKRHMDAIYDLLGWIFADDGITTVGIAMKSGEARAFLLAQFPELETVETATLFLAADEHASNERRRELCGEWVERAAALLGKREFDVPQMGGGAPDLAAQIGYVRRHNPNVEIVAVAAPESAR